MKFANLLILQHCATIIAVTLLRDLVVSAIIANTELEVIKMAIKRIVSTEFWTDKKVVEQFTPEDKLFFLYLLTNPHTTQLGIYAFIPKIAAFEIGYSKDTVLSLIERFERYGIVMFSTLSSEIAVKNYLKHSIVKGGTPVYDLLVKEANQVKDKDLLRFVLSANSDSLNNTVRQFVSDMENEDDNDNDNDNDNDDSYHESLDQNDANAFDVFWKSYPRKVSKQAAETAFKKVMRKKDHPSVEKILESVDAHKKTLAWKKDNGQYIPHASTFLNQSRWNDDLSGEATQEVKKKGDRVEPTEKDYTTSTSAYEVL